MFNSAQDYTVLDNITWIWATGYREKDPLLSD